MTSISPAGVPTVLWCLLRTPVLSAIFAALVDVLSPWCVGIPMAALGVMVLHWPVYLVMALVSLEEVVKACFGIWRLLSGKWLNNLVRDIHGGVVLAAGGS